MKQYILPAIAMVASLAAQAQCTSSVPADAVPITTDFPNVLLGQNTNYWLCDSSMAQLFMGGNNHFWVEAGGGNHGFNSAGNTIYYKGTHPLDVSGNNNTVYAVSAAAVNLQGFNSVVIECPEGVVFDYSQAPANGCMDFTGITPTIAAALGVQYDLVNDQIRLYGIDGRTNEVRLLDMTGRELERRTATAATEWSMAAYPSGYYIVQAPVGNGMLAKGFVKP